MKTQQLQFTHNRWQTTYTDSHFDSQQTQLVLAFSAASLTTNPDLFYALKERFPNADIVSSSTAGEIIGSEVCDNSMVVTAIQFEKTLVKCSMVRVAQHNYNSYETGRFLMSELWDEHLNGVFVISDGMRVNGSELVAGFNEGNLSHMKNIPVTGGLAGDGPHFNKTFVGLNQIPEEGLVVAIGFYGNSLKTGHGSFGGWDEFGPERIITRSEKNILYEIDGRNALDLYKEYLGPYKDELPGSALLFPLSIRMPDTNRFLVRTILNVNETDKSMVFAGNMAEGSKVRLMKANFDKLVDGSSIAAQTAFTALSEVQPGLILLISCVGRKLILQERTDEEVEAVRKVFGDGAPIAGFYSYGEISPFNPLTSCEFHNQTMTITTFSEC